MFVDYIASNHSFTMPVKEIVRICRRLRDDVIVVIDAAHAIGSISGLDLQEIGGDVFFANCHKWLCSPKVLRFFTGLRGWEIYLRFIHVFNLMESALDFIQSSYGVASKTIAPI